MACLFAAQLMPDESDESDETASVLCTAGEWLKNLDPKGANKFYKALVTRGGTTALGRASGNRTPCETRLSARESAGQLEFHAALG